MHYVCSDIHGRWNRYEAMLNGLKLSGDDHLYILGDVIDRGEDGIRILQHIMRQENMTFFMGNHELFFYNCTNTADEDWMDAWFYNGGEKTAKDFLNLKEEEQKELMEFLESSLVVIPDLVVGAHHYYLVHACPDLSYLHQPVSFSQMVSEKGGMERFCDMVWKRVYRPSWTIRKALGTLEKMGRELIIGHTVTTHFGGGNFGEDGKPRIYRGDHFTDIDCGCAMRNDRGCLGVLRLEDRKEFYF